MTPSPRAVSACADARSGSGDHQPGGREHQCCGASPTGVGHLPQDPHPGGPSLAACGKTEVVVLPQDAPPAGHLGPQGTMLSSCTLEKAYLKRPKIEIGTHPHLN
jgi:hypothetical protein